MSTPHYRHHIGVRFTEDECRGLQSLVKASDSNMSVVIRFLVRTATKRPDVVAAGIQRERAQQNETS